MYVLLLMTYTVKYLCLTMLCIMLSKYCKLMSKVSLIDSSMTLSGLFGILYILTKIRYHIIFVSSPSLKPLKK